jgi:hypothetical protein
VLRAALEKAGRIEGPARAAALADGLAEVPADFVPRFYDDRVRELRRLGPGQRVLDGAEVLAALGELQHARGRALLRQLRGKPPLQARQPRDPPLDVRYRQLPRGALPS